VPAALDSRSFFCQDRRRGTAATGDAAVEEIYAGPKAALRPIHDRVMQAIEQLGPFEIAPSSELAPTLGAAPSVTIAGSTMQARLEGSRLAAVVLAVFVAYWFLEELLVLVPGYRGLFDRFEYYVPRSLLSVAEIALVLLAVCWLHRLGPPSGLRELGLRSPAARAGGFGLVATAPMWLVFAATHDFAPDPVPELLYGSLLSPLAEELVFRGFLFGQLWRRAGWGLWPALAVSSLAFGYGHAEDAARLTEGLGLLAVTALGAAIFAWLYSRWGTLVAPLALHVLMNASWGLWQVGDGALAGWVPFALQLTTVTLAIVLTLMAAKRGWMAAADDSATAPVL